MNSPFIGFFGFGFLGFGVWFVWVRFSVPFPRVGSGSRVGPGFLGNLPLLIAAVFSDMQFRGEVTFGCLAVWLLVCFVLWF